MKSHTTGRTSKRQRQGEEGYVLVIALVVMTALTVLGVASMSTTNIDLNITGNLRRTEIARYASIAGTEHARMKLSEGGLPDPSQVMYFGESSGSVPYYVDYGEAKILPTTGEDGSTYRVMAQFVKCGGAPSGYSLEHFHSQYFDFISNGYLVDSAEATIGATQVTSALTVRKVLEGVCYMR